MKPMTLEERVMAAFWLERATMSMDELANVFAEVMQTYNEALASAMKAYDDAMAERQRPVKEWTEKPTRHRRPS